MITQTEARRNKRELRRLYHLLKGWYCDSLPDKAVFFANTALNEYQRGLANGLAEVGRFTIVGKRNGSSVDLYFIPFE